MSLGVYLFYLAFLILIPLLAQGKVKRAYKNIRASVTAQE